MENILVYCTVPNDFSANLIATSLVDEQLAACVNIIDSVTSVYRWEGQVQTDKELLLIIKTQKSKFDALKRKFSRCMNILCPKSLLCRLKSDMMNI